MERPPVPRAWEELVRTAAAVRAESLSGVPVPGGHPLRDLLRPVAMSAGLLVAGALAVLHLAGTTGVARANTGQDSTLFSLTNQDRTSNGVHALTFSGTLQNIGEGAPYNCKGVAVRGRSDDMIQRNYFAHPILGCGLYVFSMMQAYGIHYKSAGENIGWESGSGSPAGYINSAFMASTDHRSNILNGNYTEMGVGSDESASGVDWTGVGSPGYQNVWMFSEEFAQVGSASLPPPKPTPKPRPGGTSRNSPAPSPPSVPPATIAPATPLPTVAIPIGSLPGDLAPPPVSQYEGLLPNSIESVLEAFLNF